MYAAPVIPCGGCEATADAYPGAGGGVSRGGGVVIRIGVAQAAVALVAALPVVLDFNAVVAVGVDGVRQVTIPLGADDDGSLLTVNSGFGVDADAMTVCRLGTIGGSVRDEGHGVAVARLFAVVAAVMPLVGDEVVVCLMGDTGDEEGGGLTITGVDVGVGRMVCQGDGAAGCGGADCACGGNVVTTGVDGVHTDAGVAFAFGAVVVGVLAGAILLGEGVAQVLLVAVGAGAVVLILALVDLVGAVVPGDGFDPMGCCAIVFVPAVYAVLWQDGA